MRLIIICYFTLRLYFEEGLHIPVLIVENEEFEVIIQQNIELGYIFQALSFLFLFPLTWFQIKFNSHFEVIQDQKNIQSLIKRELNLDQLIAEERVRQRYQRRTNFAEMENEMKIIRTKIPSRRAEE